MSTTLTPELSKRNPYYIPKERMYELKHFVRQYKMWADILDGVSYYQSPSINPRRKSADISDPVARVAENRELALRNLRLVEDCALAVDSVIGPYLLAGLCEGTAYEQLNARYSIPCSKGTYYKLYRKFFWLLDKKRG